MESLHSLFLQAIDASIAGQQVNWGNEVTAAQYSQMLKLAQEHHVLPLFFEATYRCHAVSQIEPNQLQRYRSLVRQHVTAQSMRTAAFLELNRAFGQENLAVVVVKGLACRSLYPLPDHRPSADEDLLCRADQFEACHRVLIAQGLQPDSNDLDAYEVSYRSPTGLHIELHKSLFPEDSDIFAVCNDFFSDTFSKLHILEVDGQQIYTLDPTDHLLYLILHAYKHFLHSGFGIRQVCDIVVFANTYGECIHWELLYQHCQTLRAEHFAAALFAIGDKHLGFTPQTAHYPDVFSALEVDIQPLLQDILNAGIYGSSDRNRLHSSNMTLQAVSAGKKGQQTTGILAAIFPSARALQARYPYLKTKSFLLPIAWISRIFGYCKEIATRQSAGQTALQIGRDRIKLLRIYNIID